MTEQFGPYRVGTRLGRGGMGEVHEAFDTVRERTVALKRLLADDQDDPDVRERFRRESRIAARLDSPHVVPIHDFGVIEDRMFIDMRLVRGRDLGALIAAEGPLPAERAVGIVEQVADALDAAHEAGIVHRDVKPSNVLLAARDFVYLADFGIVHVREATNQPRLTATGSSLGTPSYMAPEQLRAEPFDQRLDVYALGCVLFEALVGHAPFVGERMAVMLSHLNDEPPRPSALAPSVPPELDDVVLGALAKDPAERHASTGALAAAARTALDRLGSSTEARTYDVHTVPARPAEPVAHGVEVTAPGRGPATPPRVPALWIGGPQRGPAWQAPLAAAPGVPPRPGPGVLGRPPFPPGPARGHTDPPSVPAFAPPSAPAAARRAGVGRAAFRPARRGRPGPRRRAATGRCGARRRRPAPGRPAGNRRRRPRGGPHRRRDRGRVLLRADARRLGERGRRPDRGAVRARPRPGDLPRFAAGPRRRLGGLHRHRWRWHAVAPGDRDLRDG